MSFILSITWNLVVGEDKHQRLVLIRHINQNDAAFYNAIVELTFNRDNDKHDKITKNSYKYLV